MEVLFKIIIAEDKRVSLIFHKTTELSELLEKLIDVLEYAFDNVHITSQDNHYHIAGISREDTFNTIISFIEEVYIRFIYDDD